MAEITLISLQPDQLLSKAQDLKEQGYRLVQIHCNVLKQEPVHENLEINYTFDLDYNLTNLRIRIAQEQEIPSLSAFFPAAFLYENEMHDLFGITVKSMSIDYQGNLYKTSIPTPFNPAKKPANIDGKVE